MALTKQKKQIIILYTSTFFGVVLGILSSIVNTKFMSPVDYGDVRYIQNIISFITSFLLFGYFLSGSRLLALSTDETYNRRIKGVMIIILFAACIILCLSMVGCFILHQQKPIALLFLISIPVCFYPLFLNYVDQTAAGDNQIGRLSLARLLPYSIYVPLAYILYSAYGANSTKMILLQWGVYSVVYIFVIISTKPLFKNLQPVWGALKKENKQYGIQLYIGSLMMVATNYLAGISLGYFNSDNSEVGFYTLSLIVTAPLAYLPSIVGTTYFKRFATQPKIPNKVIVYTTILTFASFLVFLIIIRPVVIMLYSERYAIVGTYASFLALGYCLHGMGDMFNRYLCSHGQGISVRNASIANGVFKMLGYVFLVALFNTNGAIATTIICDVIYCSCLVLYYIKFTKNYNSWTNIS